MRRLSLVPVLALLLAPAAYADELFDDYQRTTHITVEHELWQLARFAARNGNYHQARKQLRIVLQVNPNATRCRRKLKSLAGKRGTPREGMAVEFRGLKKTAYAKCGDALADLVLLCKRRKLTSLYRRYLDATLEHFRSEKVMRVLDLAYFKPYLKWVSQEDYRRLKAGWEQIDGKWLDKAKVKAHNTKHAYWDNPWILDDGVHELRTTLNVRAAKRILAYVGTYRRWFLKEYGSLWDLRPPKGKLPIIVTVSHAAMMDQMARAYAKLGYRMPNKKMLGAAYYLLSPYPLNPCLVTLEPMSLSGRTFRLSIRKILLPLTHELVHQLAFEYSKHAADKKRRVQHHYWSVEGFANFLAFHTFTGTEWKLTHPRTIDLGSGLIESPFSWCLKNKADLPRLEEFFKTPRASFMSARNYNIATLAAYFFLTWKRGKYREPFIKLLQSVHQVRDSAKLFDVHFPHSDMALIEREWRLFLDRIELED